MNTQEILKLIYETKDLNRFKNGLITYWDKRDIDYDIEPLYEGFRRKYQRLIFRFYSKPNGKPNNNFYILGFRTLNNHYIFIDDVNQTRFYERKLSLQQVTERITLDPYYKFMEDNEELLEYLKKEYTKWNTQWN